MCVAIRNRSRCPVGDAILPLFPACVRSIEQAFPEAEILAADWDSTDWPLAQWFRHTAIPMAGRFNKAVGLEKCVRRAASDNLLLLDADMLITSPLPIERGLAAAASGKAYFPVCWSYSNPGHTTGWWRESAFGTVLLRRDLYRAVGAWPSQHTWGGDDTEFFRRMADRGLAIRERAQGLFHQWHPDLLGWDAAPFPTRARAPSPSVPISVSAPGPAPRDPPLRADFVKPLPPVRFDMGIVAHLVGRPTTATALGQTASQLLAAIPTDAAIMPPDTCLPGTVDLVVCEPDKLDIARSLLKPGGWLLLKGGATSLAGMRNPISLGRHLAAAKK